MGPQQTSFELVGKLPHASVEGWLRLAFTLVLRSVNAGHSSFTGCVSEAEESLISQIVGQSEVVLTKMDYLSQESQCKLQVLQPLSVDGVYFCELGSKNGFLQRNCRRAVSRQANRLGEK